MYEFVLNVLSLIVGSCATWLVIRKKQDAETTKLHLENINIAVAIWKDTAQDLAIKVDQLRAEVEALRQENVDLKAKLDKTILTIDKNAN